MALINCPECGREISDKAASCPQCGNPISEKENDVKHAVIVQKEKSSAWIWIIVIIVGIGILGASGAFSNATASLNLDVKIDEGGVNALGACFVKGKVTNTGNSDVSECTITFDLISDSTKEYVGKAITKFSTIKAKETLSYEANGVCDNSVKEAKWKVDIKCGNNN